MKPGRAKKVLEISEHDKSRKAPLDGDTGRILSSKIMKHNGRTSGFTLIEVLVSVMLS